MNNNNNNNNNNKKNKIIKLVYSSDSDSDDYEITPRAVIKKEKRKEKIFFITNEELKNIEDKDKNTFLEDYKKIIRDGLYNDVHYSAEIDINSDDDYETIKEKEYNYYINQQEKAFLKDLKNKEIIKLSDIE